ncbi:MAG: hypothetical protein ABJD68_09285 [Nakamurella sp.]
MAISLTGLLVVATMLAAPVTAADAEQRAVDSSVAAASALGIQQSIAVIDRATGDAVASSGADLQYISESIVKLFTVAYYEVQANGAADAALSDELRTMIEQSDDDIESQLWNIDIVPAMAQRYGLAHTGNGPRTGPHDWGWEMITAGDEAKFLFQMSLDPEVAPLLTDAMANVASTGSDGFDQEFGLDALAGDHGSKQGWTDVDEATDRIQIHSVGWTDQYFVAILQTSTSADDDTLRAAATSAARAIESAESSAMTTATALPPTTDDAPSGIAVVSQLAQVIGQVRQQIGTALQRALGLPGGG